MLSPSLRTKDTTHPHHLGTNADLTFLQRFSWHESCNSDSAVLPASRTLEMHKKEQCALQTTNAIPAHC